MAKRSSKADLKRADTEAANADKNAGKLGYKVLAGAGAAVGGTIARKALNTGWKTATGKEPPTSPERPDVRWAEAATWAALSAAGVAVVRLLAQRRVAATWQRASGHLPPGMDDTAT
jgi:hypothetical protein